MSLTSLPDSQGVKLRIWGSRFDAPNSSHARVAAQFPFLHSIEIIVSSPAAMPHLAPLLQEHLVYYETPSAPVTALFDSDMAGVGVICHTARVNADPWAQRDSISGKVTIQLTQPLAVTVGLDGRYDSTNHVWRVALDGKTPLPARVRKAVERMPQLGFRALGLSMATAGAEWQRQQCRFSSRRVSGVTHPELGHDASAQKVLSWTGAMLAGADEARGGATVGVARWEGLMGSMAGGKAVEGIRELVRAGHSEWALVIVRGYEDELVAAGHERTYMIAVRPGGERYWGYVMAKDLPI